MYVWMGISQLILMFALFMVLVNASRFDGGKAIPDEQRLITKLFRNYDNSVRPVFNATTSVNVSFGLTLIQIMNMDEKNQVLVTNVWLEHVWVDERMLWDPADYSGLEVVRIPAAKLWLPDIVLYNNADDFTTGYMPSNAMVGYDGVVFWSPPARLISSCKVDITYFPFDEQTCGLKFGSWTYDQAQVDISNKSVAVDMSNYISNGEWELRRTFIQRNAVVYPISPAVYPDVTVYFVMKRRILYYILNIILPCVWLNMLSLLAFCLPPDAGEKITLGITVLLSYSVFMLLVAENMPQTSEYVPLIGIYLTLSMAMTSISVILTVCVLKLHHCGPYQSKVPRYLKVFVLGCLAKLVRCQCRSDKDMDRRRYLAGQSGKRLATHEGSDICLRLMSDVAQNKFSSLADLKNNLHANQNHAASEKHHVTFTSNHVNQESSSYRPKSRISPAAASIYKHQKMRPKSESTNAIFSTESSNPPTENYLFEMERLSVLDDILHNIKILVNKRHEDDVCEYVENEWRLVAQVMDRFLFWTFLFITLVATVLIMILIPLLRYMEETAQLNL